MCRENPPVKSQARAAAGAARSIPRSFGARRRSKSVAVWPFASVTARVLSGEGMLKRVTVTGGFWNSLHAGDIGSDGPMTKAWYESRLWGGVDLHLGRGVVVGTSYTAYISPNNLFTTAKAIGIRVAMDDGGSRAAVRPYTLVVLEVDAAAGVGQLDGGLHSGRYLEGLRDRLGRRHPPTLIRAEPRGLCVSGPRAGWSICSPRRASAGRPSLPRHADGRRRAAS
jgi:hypothetical protein